jgi:hypothetical protein
LTVAILAAVVLTAVVLGIARAALWPTDRASTSCRLSTVAHQSAAFFGNNEDNDDARQVCSF